MMSSVFFKNLGASNDFISLVTNLLTIPWTVKPLWSALVDIYSTKRNWILCCQIALSLATALLALTPYTAYAIALSVLAFALIAITSATHDIAIDGFYLESLDKSSQALFVGLRNTAYKLAWLLGSGGLVYLAGKLGERFGIATGWAAAFAACALILALAWAFHSWYLPQPESEHTSQREPKLTWAVLVKVFSTYFAQKRIAAIVLYILTFRMGDALMLSVAQLFLLDTPEKGGLAISTADVGIIYGTVGTIALLAGGIVGGWLVAKDGLKRWLWPTALFQNSAIILYWWLAVYKPSVTAVAIVNAIEQFSYGLGVAAYTVFLLSTVKPDYKAAHYAIATGMMALGLLIPGAVSGALSIAWGYPNFFLVSFVCSIPGIITIFFLPIDGQQGKAAEPVQQ